MAEPIDPGVAVYTVIRQRPRPEAKAPYEAWLNEIVPASQSFPGHRGVNIIRPHDATQPYTIVLHFDSLDHLRGWLDSGTRARLIAKARPMLVADESIDIQTGLEYWFTPPGQRQAKPYKQFLVTLSAIFPLTVLIPWLLQPLFARVPLIALPGIGHLIVATIIVGLMTYVIMPRYTRLIARWLFR